MSKIKVEIRGIPGVMNKMNSAVDKRVIPAFERGIHKGGFIVEAEIKKLSPIRTGRLRRAIHTVLGKMSASVVSGVDYNIHQEFGTSRMPGKPHFRPGVSAAAPKVKKAVSDEIKMSLRGV